MGFAPRQTRPFAFGMQSRAPPRFAQRAAQPFQQEEEEKEKERTAEEKEETQQSGNREEASHSARDVPGGL